MNLDEALKRLDIEEYKERIFNSNSRGELMHIVDYGHAARVLPDDQLENFKKVFEACVKEAEETWERPESVFQHMPAMFRRN